MFTVKISSVTARKSNPNFSYILGNYSNVYQSLSLAEGTRASGGISAYDLVGIVSSHTSSPWNTTISSFQRLTHNNEHLCF